MPEDYKEFISLRMLARNWKHQWLPLCLARQARHVSMEWPVVNAMRSNQNLRVFSKPMNPQDCVWKNLDRIIMRTILQDKGTNHCNIKIWFTNFSYASSHDDSRSKGSSGQGMGKIGENSGRGTWQKSEVKKRWSMKQGRRAQKFILPHWWTSVMWRMPNWRQSTKNTKVELYSEAILWKMILDLMQYSRNKDHQHHKWQQQKSWISSPDCLVARDKQLMQYPLIPR